MLLRELIEKKRVKFIDGASDWRTAVRLSCETLVGTGAVDESYADGIIDCVEKYGPYIVLQPGFALPHCQENAVGAKETAIAFMKSKTPVAFEPGNPEMDAQVFFTISAVDHDAHLDNIGRLFRILEDESFCEALLAADGEADLLAADAAAVDRED